MYFDRFDICLAHWAFACSWHDGMGSETYAKFAQLNRVGFRPGGCQSEDPKDLGDNAREIYRQLVVSRCGIKSTLTA
tara:strand:+ start:367 stop:597 length:231 start_codon:yes stop_codon:yes gene_type:complete